MGYTPEFPNPEKEPQGEKGTPLRATSLARRLRDEVANVGILLGVTMIVTGAILFATYSYQSPDTVLRNAVFIMAGAGIAVGSGLVRKHTQ